MAVKVNTQRGRSACVWLILLTCLGCNSLLGNERVHAGAVPSDQQAGRRDSGIERVEVHDAGVAIDAAMPSVRAAMGGRGPSNDAPVNAGRGGTTAADAEREADPPEAPAADSGAGSDSAPEPDSTGIRGTVVDLYRRPVPDAWVWLDTQSVQTDRDGKFSFAAAASVYDLTLTVSHTDASGAPLREVWRYEGLTRRDPTVQCYSGFGYRSANIHMHVALDGFPQAGGPFVVAAFASPDVGMGWWVDKAEFVPPALSWFGPDLQTVGNVHALLYQTDPTGLPMAYHAHMVAPAVLGNSTTDVTLSFPASNIGTIRLAGRVSGPHERARNDLLVQHFGDGTELTIPLSIQSQEAFSYLAPSAPDSSTTLILREGGISPPYAAAVIEGSMNERSDLALEIPRTPQLTAPGDGKSGVDDTTAFAWTLSEPRVSMFVAYSSDLADVLYVVTGNTQTQLPSGASYGYSVPAGTSFSWHVYTRDATSIDELTADVEHTMLTTRWRAGHYAASVPRTFVTAE